MTIQELHDAIKPLAVDEHYSTITHYRIECLMARPTSRRAAVYITGRGVTRLEAWEDAYRQAQALPEGSPF